MANKVGEKLVKLEKYNRTNLFGQEQIWNESVSQNFKPGESLQNCGHPKSHD